MRLHRFFIGTSLRPNAVLTIEDEQLVHQLTSVLRLGNGDTVMLLDGVGHEAKGVIESIEKKRIRVQTGPAIDIIRPTAREVTLCCAVLKRENMEWVVQKATETGVTRIIPLLTDRTVKTNVNLERLTKIAIEAMEQSGGGYVPVIEDPVTVEKALAMTEGSTRLFFHFGGDQAWDRSLNDSPVSAWIGPEGGWSDREIALAQAQNLTTASLGSMTLRAETAAVIATYLAGHS